MYPPSGQPSTSNLHQSVVAWPSKRRVFYSASLSCQPQFEPPRWRPAAARGAHYIAFETAVNSKTEKKRKIFFAAPKPDACDDPVTSHRLAPGTGNRPPPWENAQRRACRTTGNKKTALRRSGCAGRDSLTVESSRAAPWLLPAGMNCPPGAHPAAVAQRAPPLPCRHNSARCAGLQMPH